MPKITDKPLKLIQVRIFEEDYTELRRLYSRDVGVNKAIRAMVHSFLTNTNGNINEAIDKLEG